MDDRTLDSVLDIMSQHRPRAPESLVRRMETTVQNLEAERLRRSEKGDMETAAGREPAQPEAAREAEKAMKPKPPRVPGM